MLYNRGNPRKECMTLKKDLLQISVSATRAEMGKAAADCAAAHIRRLLAEKESINVIFAAAPSQNEVLEELLLRDVDFARINAYHMDEYVGLSPTDAQSFAQYLTQHIFSRAPFRSVNLIDTSKGAEQACRVYTELLQKNPPDLVLMGIGENGHIAFNDPPVADFADKAAIKAVELDPICRQQQVNDKCFPTLADVPTHAVTLTVPTLMSAGALVCTVPGPTKAWAVKHTVEDEISEKCPATVMRRHPNATMFLDADSAADLLK